MGPIRQLEAAELMSGQNNYSVQFAEALLATTPDTALAVPRRKPPKRDGQVSTEQMAKMERGLASLLRRDIWRRHAASRSGARQIPKTARQSEGDVLAGATPRRISRKIPFTRGIRR